MYIRLLNPAPNHSYFLFGPRGTGKTTWIRSHYPKAVYIDLLQTNIYSKLQANPEILESYIPRNFNNFIIIDEVQRIPELLNEVHRLIESPKHYKFILTGSSARKLRRQGVNLLAGRAYTYNIYPLIIQELGEDFDLQKSLRFGTLPAIYSNNNPDRYLQSYLSTYLEQEINQEGMTRNLGAFYRFLQVASYSQGSPLNTSSIAREVGVKNKVVDNYFTILIDLLIGSFLPAFTRRAKRRLVSKPKFYLFDSGIYNTARPKGYLDKDSEIDGISLETLFLNHLKAVNEYHSLEYSFSYFRTASGLEVDFIAYGPRGFHAFEIKLSKNIHSKHLKGLRAFSRDYPEAKLHLLYTGDKELYFENIIVTPIETALSNLLEMIRDHSSAVKPK